VPVKPHVGTHGFRHEGESTVLELCSFPSLSILSKRAMVEDKGYEFHIHSQRVDYDRPSVLGVSFSVQQESAGTVKSGFSRTA